MMQRTRTYVGRFWDGGWPVVVEDDGYGRWLVIELTEDNPRRDGTCIVTSITRMYLSKDDAIRYAWHLCDPLASIKGKPVGSSR
jgi:NADH dehydrogenase/NADH:ubiquinone oxidoreductase subunit G